MSTMSMSGDSTISRQSVAEYCQPSCARAACTPAASRPQMVWSSMLPLRLKNLGAWRQALEWARPMNLYPISPTLNVLAIKVGVELNFCGFIVSRDKQVNSMSFTTAEIAKRLDGELLG